MQVKWLDSDIGSIECCGQEMIVHEYDSTDPPEPCEVCGKRYVVIPSRVEEWGRSVDAT